MENASQNHNEIPSYPGGWLESKRRVSVGKGCRHIGPHALLVERIMVQLPWKSVAPLCSGPCPCAHWRPSSIHGTAHSHDGHHSGGTSRVPSPGHLPLTTLLKWVTTSSSPLLPSPHTSYSHSLGVCLPLDRSHPLEHSVVTEMFSIWAVQYTCHEPPVAFEHLNVASGTEQLNF